MDEQAKQTFENLRNGFGITKQFVSRPLISKCSIGVEVEVKWKAYFPDLWKIAESYGGMTAVEEDHPEVWESIWKECTLRERMGLHAILYKITSLGVPRGNDKYWEFALHPSFDVQWTVETLKILVARGAIPRTRHSLHITIADLKPTRMAYHMLMMLELLFCTKERIAAGFHQSNQKLSGSWSRKGMAGIFVKDAKDLQYGATTALELRTLELNYADEDIENLFDTVVLLTNALHDAQRMEMSDTVKAEAYYKLSDAMTSALQSCGLEDKNWKKPHMDPNSWQGFIHNFDILKTHAQSAWEEFLLDSGEI